MVTLASLSLHNVTQVTVEPPHHPGGQSYVMRKIVIDGSNVSGFQRTALIAMNGYVDTSKGKVHIPSICLEEESAKKIKSPF